MSCTVQNNIVRVGLNLCKIYFTVQTFLNHLYLIFFLFVPYSINTKNLKQPKMNSKFIKKCTAQQILIVFFYKVNQCIIYKEQQLFTGFSVCLSVCLSIHLFIKPMFTSTGFCQLVQWYSALFIKNNICLQVCLSVCPYIHQLSLVFIKPACMYTSTGICQLVLWYRQSLHTKPVA